MGFLNTALGLDLPWKNNATSIQEINEVCTPLEIVGYRKLAIEIAIDLVGNSVSRVEWRKFQKGKQKHDNVEYLLNHKPNKFDSKQSFSKKLTRRLLLDRKALVIPHNGELYIADSFHVDYKDFNVIEFTSVMINGHDAPRPKYNQDTAIYVDYENKFLTTFLNAYQNDYDGLVESATNGYQSNKLRKYYLDSDAFRAQDTKKQAEFNALVEQNFKSFINSTRRTAIYAKPKGYTINKLEDAQQETANDVRNLINDVFQMTGNAFHIPPTLMLTGEATQVQTDNYLMFAVYPIIDAFMQAFNNFNYKESDINKETLVKYDVSKTKVIDLATTADFVSKVFPTGALTLNDVIVKYLNLDTPPEDVGEVRVITKNYDKVENFVKGKVTPAETVDKEEYINEDNTANNDNKEDTTNGN